MAGPYRIVSPFSVALLLLGLLSCGNPNQGTQNTAPWPVSGPTGPIFLTATGGNSMSFELEITNNLNLIVTNPGPFDPDNDIVEFIEVIETIDGVDVGGVPAPAFLPIVEITPDGVFHIAGDATLVGHFATFTVSVSDGEFTVPYVGTNQITIFFI